MELLELRFGFIKARVKIQQIDQMIKKRKLINVITKEYKI
jgi:hypothetical protein